ncbi:RICIN domain-containing protein [Streptomyces chattanoogensis]
MSTTEEATTVGEPSTAEQTLVGPDPNAVVCSWANVRSRLRMAVQRESTRDGAEIHQSLAAPRGHQRWRLIVVGQDNEDDLYKIENVRSGKVLEVGAQEVAGAVVVQRAYEGDDAHHQQWKLIPVGSETATPRVYEIANRKSGLFLRVDSNARTAIKQYGAEEGDPRERQWQLLPV